MDPMDVDDVDVDVLVDQLIDPTLEVSTGNMALLTSLLWAVTQQHMRGRAATAVQLMLTEQSSRTGADRLLAMTRIMVHVHEWFMDNPFCPGQGYSHFPKMPNKVRVQVDHVGANRGCPMDFRAEIGLYPDEFDMLFSWVQPAMQQLTERRHVTLENRLAMTLRRLKTGHTITQTCEYFGLNDTCGGKDIHDIVDILFESVQLRGEIRWPSPAEIDEEVRRVAEWKPGLIGAFCAVDGKKRWAAHGGRTTDRDMHRVNYESNKGHGKMLFIVTVSACLSICLCDGVTN
jgi:hypothetical protein